MVKMALKKQELSARLLQAASALIAEKGLTGLKARDVADKAGCALGGLYTVYADLDALVFAVNLQSFERLDAMMRETVVGATTAEAQLQALVKTYLAFATSEPMMWRAMFEHRIAEDKDFPVEHFQALEALMQHIVQPLSQVAKELDAEALKTRARTWFSAFHGVITLSLDKRFTGLSGNELESELREMLAVLLRGAKSNPQ